MGKAVPALLEKVFERPRTKHHEAHKHARAYKVLSVLALIALVLQSSMLFLSLFEQPLPYTISNPGPEPIDAPEFGDILGKLTGGGWSDRNRVDVLTNGDQFYASELDAIEHAKRFVHIECYIFQQGRVTDRILNLLEQRAQAGVEVRLVIDAMGSAGFPKQRFEKLEQLGGRVAWYHPLRWYNWTRANNRTHRELVVVDGAIGFAGGAGFADQWMYTEKKEPQWRDTMVRLEGPAAADLNATFAENWLESSGEVLVAPQYFPAIQSAGGTRALVVTSSPMVGRSTEARVLFQALYAKASHTVHITNPYFLPDKNLRQELVNAVRRGADVTILVPGAKNDHLLTRRSSRALYGDLLKAGARIFEYQPSMVHAKISLIDGKWAVAGSTNLDSRSFGLNDEVNVAMPDPYVVARLEQDFQQDLARSRQVTYDQWKRRPWYEKLQEWCGWLIQNQE
jgi:cardiolipin synthase A/B